MRVEPGAWCQRGQSLQERGGPEHPTAAVVAALRCWLLERAGQASDPVFPARTGRPLSRDALEHRLRMYVVTAIDTCPSLRGKPITLHVLRHTAEMRLLHAGVDTSVIALWLGHEHVDTMQIYTTSLGTVPAREAVRSA